MNDQSTYDDRFFDQREALVRESARRIVPLVIELVSPASVIDVGCGDGVWLAVFQEQGVADVAGIDGPWVSADRLKIDPQRFESRDLNQPIEPRRQYDLAMSLEVAEHLAPAGAQQFIANLTALAPVVLFSAAVKLQGGTGHVNEQWQSYWADRFGERDYVPVDCIRWRIWDDEAVAWWYRQNTLVYVRGDRLSDYPKLAAERDLPVRFPLSIAHPERYEKAAAPRLANLDALSLSDVLRITPRLLKRAVVGRVARLFGKRP